MNLPDRVAFTVFGISIYWYAILISIGIIAAVIVAGICAKRRNMPTDTPIDLCLLAVPLGLIFARLYYVLFNLDYYKTFADVINIRNGGLAIPGGIIGGLLGIFIYSLIKKKKIWGYLDVVAPGVALAQAIGRWGNFFNQEAYGTAVTNPKLMFFPFAVRIEDCSDTGCTITAQHGHLATFFYESMICLVLFIVLMIMFNRVKRNGDIFLTYLAVYTFERAGIEQLRTDSLMLGNVRITQALYAAIFVAVIVFIVVRAIIEKKRGALILPLDPDEYKVAEPDVNEDGETDETENSGEESTEDSGSEETFASTTEPENNNNSTEESD